MTDFGRLLRSKRCSAGLSQTKLGESIGVGQSRIAQLESNIMIPNSGGLITRLAEAIGCPSDDLCIAAGVLPPDMTRDLGKVVEMWRAAQ